MLLLEHLLGELLLLLGSELRCWRLLLLKGLLDELLLLLWLELGRR